MKSLSVRQVRDALAAASPASQRGGRAGAELGALFHDALSYAVQPDVTRSMALAGREPAARREFLRGQIYTTLVGPRLTRDQARLQAQSPGVLELWAAIEWLCEWVAGWGRLGELAVIDTEEPVERVLHQPGWREPVKLVGRPDLLIRPPGDLRWCLVELKLGGTHPEADLAQVVLYHELIQACQSRQGVQAPPTDVALVRFEPTRREIMIAPEQLIQARAALINLIGRLAGVAGPEPVLTRSRVVPVGVQLPPSIPRTAVNPGTGHEAMAGRIVRVLAEFGLSVKRAGQVVAGPAFIRVPLEPGRGVKVQSICQRARDLQVRLGLDRPPFISTSGSHVVIDLQRSDRQSVRFSSICDQIPSGDPLTGSPSVPLGVDLDGQLRLADLSRPEHTHLLVAGTTGSGKSEWLNAAIAGLIQGNQPHSLRLVLIDPKRVGFRRWRDSAYLHEPILNDQEAATEALERLVEEMDARYAAMEQAQVDHWSHYIRSTGQASPRIVCVCDEYADLLAGDRNQRKVIEALITRLGSKARAAGIHLIVATQHPSREVIKGALDATIPARVGLQMARDIESRMLLGTAGAENLLGRGDLLFKDLLEPVRLQGLWLDIDR